MRKIFYQLFYCATIALMFASSAFAQTGSIKGQIIDSTLNEALIGATIQLENTTIGASADVEGNYQITGIQAGNYTLVCTMVGYQTQKITGIQVQAGKTVLLNVNLKTEANALGEVVLTVQKETMGELAVISEIKGAEQVAVGMSGEQISKTQDRDAAQVVKRIAGVSIFDDRFIMIRGLSQRYNTVMLNDAIAPSSEVDIRAFSFDMLPSSAIDRILIYKSGAGELPGEFAGGVVKVYTKLAPTENFTSIGIGTGFRVGTTFQNAPTYKGSGTDFLGFDNGKRALPAGIPDVRTFGNLTRQQTAEWGRKFQNVWAIEETNVKPDTRINYTMGRRFSVGSTEVGNLTAITYSNTHTQLQDATLKRFGNIADDPNDLEVSFKDRMHTNNVRMSVISNWSAIFNRYNKVEFRNFFNQTANKETLLREGFRYKENGAENILRYNSLRFEQRSIYSGQLSGKHNLGSERTALKWLTGFGYTNRNEPDFRRYLQSRALNSDTPFAINLVPSPNAQNSRFFSKMNEYVLTGSVNFEQNLDDKEENANPSKLRVGVYTERKNRVFTSRTLGYTTNPNSTLALTLPIEQYYSTTNINGTDIYMSEGTLLEDDAYKANNLLIAPYASLFYGITENFSVALGARLEYNNQELLTDPNGKGYTRKRGGKELISFLPSLNLTYNLTDKSLLRLAYASTINRPEFRELASFPYYEPNLDAVQQGNPTIGIARIQNVDMRWELYPTPNETIVFGAFYKYFRNPIENQLTGVTGVNTYTFIQAESAENFGVELELRKNLGSKFTAVLNASYIVSNVTNGDSIRLNETITLPTLNSYPEKRVMYGQSPYLINAGIFYNDEVSKWQVSLLYNIFGRRLFAIGNITTARSLYEMPRHGLDLTVSKALRNGLEIRFGAQDLLNPAFKVVEDSFENGKGVLNSVERKNIAFQSRRGQYFTLGLNYKF